MLAMPRWVIHQMILKWQGLFLASVLPFMLFLGLLYFDHLLAIQPEGLVGESAKQQRKDVLGYGIYAVLLLLIAAHGFLWTSARLMLSSKDGYIFWGERFGFPLGFAPLKSFFWTLTWLLFAMFSYIAIGMVVGTFGFNDPSLLFEGTGEQTFTNQVTSKAGLNDRELIKSSTQINTHSFHPWVLLLAKVIGAGFAVWILTKAFVAIPLRTIQGSVNLLNALDATPGFKGIRMAFWVILGASLIWLIHQYGLVPLPFVGKLAGQSLLFLVSLWSLGGLLSWHAQKYVE